MLLVSYYYLVKADQVIKIIKGVEELKAIMVKKLQTAETAKVRGAVGAILEAVNTYVIIISEVNSPLIYCKDYFI